MDDDDDETKVGSLYYGMTWLWYFVTVRYTQSQLITTMLSLTAKKKYKNKYGIRHSMTQVSASRKHTE